LHAIVDKFKIISFFLLNSAKLRSDEALYLVVQKKYKKKLKYKKQLNQVIDDYTIARIMCNDNCIGYNIQINEYSTGSKRRDALLFTHRPEKLGFNFDGCKQFYHNCYVDSSNVTNVINNFNQLVTKGSVNISNECFDFDSKTWKTFTNKFELATMP
jgi:DNA-directed RNA polymerase subunit N (RpoN/RPB10)